MLGAPPATTRTDPPGLPASGGPTVRQASGMLSLMLATATGSMPAGSGTSMESANGTLTRSLMAPPQSLPEIVPSPYIARLGSTPVQLAVSPRRQRSHSPHVIWNGTTTLSPVLQARTSSPTS